MSFVQAQVDPLVVALRDELSIAQAANRQLHRENERLREMLADLDKEVKEACDALGEAGAKAYHEAFQRKQEASRG